jgi:hypothetical protein
MTRLVLSSSGANVSSSPALECLQRSALNQMIQRFQGKHFALRCFKQLAHIFAAYTEPTPVYAGDDLKVRVVLQAALVADFGQVPDASCVANRWSKSRG